MSSSVPGRSTCIAKGRGPGPRRIRSTALGCATKVANAPVRTALEVLPCGTRLLQGRFLHARQVALRVHVSWRVVGRVVHQRPRRRTIAASLQVNNSASHSVERQQRGNASEIDCLRRCAPRRSASHLTTTERAHRTASGVPFRPSSSCQMVLVITILGAIMRGTSRRNRSS